MICVCVVYSTQAYIASSLDMLSVTGLFWRKTLWWLYQIQDKITNSSGNCFVINEQWNMLMFKFALFLHPNINQSAYITLDRVMISQSESD